MCSNNISDVGLDIALCRILGSNNVILYHKASTNDSKNERKILLPDFKILPSQCIKLHTGELFFIQKAYVISDDLSCRKLTVCYDACFKAQQKQNMGDKGQTHIQGNSKRKRARRQGTCE